MNLFNIGDFTLHSGAHSIFKIDCDALTDDDLKCLARLITKRFRFQEVIGIPRGGLRFAEVLKPYKDAQSDVTLIVDDVLTTGRSFELQRKMYQVFPLAKYQGIVIFARGICPHWVKPIFQFGDGFEG